MTHLGNNTLEKDYTEEERSDSLITEYDETEWETNNTPIDHATPPATSVMLMNSYFDFIYAKALFEVKGVAVRKNCFGCQTDHPSQTQHDCLKDVDEYDDDEYRLDFYFEDMLQAVDEQDILHSWEDIIKMSNISPEVIEMYKRVISSKDFLDIMKTKQWQNKMKKVVMTITRRENRLFRSLRIFLQSK